MNALEQGAKIFQKCWCSKNAIMKAISTPTCAKYMNTKDHSILFMQYTSLGGDLKSRYNNDCEFDSKGSRDIILKLAESNYLYCDWHIHFDTALWFHY